MLWFFCRHERTLQLEIRHNMVGSGCELVVTYPDGRVLVEEVADSVELLTRTVEILKALRAEGWLVRKTVTPRSATIAPQDASFESSSGQSADI